MVLYRQTADTCDKGCPLFDGAEGRMGRTPLCLSVKLSVIFLSLEGYSDTDTVGSVEENCVMKPVKD